jgi:hypothetical protein
MGVEDAYAGFGTAKAMTDVANVAMTKVLEKCMMLKCRKLFSDREVCLS